MLSLRIYFNDWYSPTTGVCFKYIRSLHTSMFLPGLASGSCTVLLLLHTLLLLRLLLLQLFVLGLHLLLDMIGMAVASTFVLGLVRTALPGMLLTTDNLLDRTHIRIVTAGTAVSVMLLSNSFSLSNLWGMGTAVTISLTSCRQFNSIGTGTSLSGMLLPTGDSLS